MHVAGPIQSDDEARALEQAAYLTHLRDRLGRPHSRPPTARRGRVLDPSRL